MYVSRGAQTGIIKNSLLGLSLVIDDLMRRLISSIERLSIAFVSSFFVRIGRLAWKIRALLFRARRPDAHSLSLKFISL